ncbi:DUF742 domain-containing protein [Pseudonocardia acidicola]|uniref:DUF742 domain-containing protein n=1 Tax=Pseudonocardia acidicola TaxID=2724939 RepID=A0ABX1SI17_9PSEU|nr:DUF742 domain-containing protein [Pseudonocardia acidicola]NMI00575.1 DUF742 domain-containing protein [Pseudonocardia acidicola]
MKEEDGSWYDEEAGPLVRPYFLAGGRSRPARNDLEMITLVVAVAEELGERLGPEYAEILRLCQHPSSVAEVAAMMDLPLMVVKVILSDLIERGYVIFRSPPTTSDLPSPELLQAVLDGIRRI